MQSELPAFQQTVSTVEVGTFVGSVSVCQQLRATVLEFAGNHGVFQQLPVILRSFRIAGMSEVKIGTQLKMIDLESIFREPDEIAPQLAPQRHTGANRQNKLADARTVWRTAINNLAGDPLFPPEVIDALLACDVNWADSEEREERIGIVLEGCGVDPKLKIPTRE